MRTLSSLQMLIELRRLGTLTAVAEAFTYSTSAVSQQMNRLEKQLGVTLLVPEGRGVRLTPQAEILVIHAERILAAWEVARADVLGSLDGLVGSLKVAAFQTASLALIPPLVTEFARVHPGVTVRLRQAEPDAAVASVLTRESDMGFDFVYPRQAARVAPGAVSIPLFDDSMWLAIPQAREWAQGTTLADFSGLDWAVSPQDSSPGMWEADACRRAGFEPQIAYEASDVNVRHGLVRAGLAACFLPGLMPQGLRRRVRLIRLPADFTRTVCVVVRAESQESPLIRAAIDLLRECAGPDWTVPALPR